MNRRKLLRMAGAAGTGIMAGRAARMEAQVARATRGMPSPKIKDIQIIATQPDRVRLTVVKVYTDQDGLYGYGCGTFTQRAELVNAAVEKHLKPFLIGKPADRIEDTWQACYNSSYWRNGPVLNNAISGVDEALWDIKGRQTGMPVYQLLGGKCREAADVYVHAGGADTSEMLERALGFLAQGIRNILLNPSYATAGPALLQAPLFESGPWARRAVQWLETFRNKLGWELGLMLDVHERITPIEALQLAKEVEKFKLFFLEDLLSPEDIAWFRLVRRQCATPLAMGELFSSPHEWTPLIQERLIDYMRMHVSDMGGVTPARKVAAMGEITGVKTAWHGPPDVSPLGQMAHLHLDLACYNFGVQEYTFYSDQAKEVFKGCPEVKNGYMYANDSPGWGMEVDEKAASKFPFGSGDAPERKPLNGGWGELRRRDGTLVKQ